jgi:hypothetical protein
MNHYFSYIEFDNLIPLTLEIIDLISEENINLNDKIYAYIYHQNNDIKFDNLYIDEYGFMLKKSGDLLIGGTLINIENGALHLDLFSKRTCENAKDIRLTYEFNIKNNFLIGNLELLEYYTSPALPRIRQEKFQKNSQKWHYKYIINPFVYYLIFVPIEAIKKHAEEAYNRLIHHKRFEEVYTTDDVEL